MWHTVEKGLLRLIDGKDYRSHPDDSRCFWHVKVSIPRLLFLWTLSHVGYGQKKREPPKIT